ncbi:hypothetical protein HPB52_022169 [Rhipicephalus sanguineus]|uniref:Uncharacterized protein n=1 Tax=Rhipicephalus sanguineus TaxID=34632 RepID=A0A9D4QCH0_RHISA|nr:hypothetical protein HPB52_022169 [Rhipicephalus sanguineus]
MKCSSVALGLAAAQLVAGLGLAVLPIHTMLKLPSLATRDCPLWAAGPLLCAGIIGTIAVYSNTNYKSQNNRKPIFVLKFDGSHSRSVNVWLEDVRRAQQLDLWDDA